MRCGYAVFRYQAFQTLRGDKVESTKLQVSGGEAMCALMPVSCGLQQ